MGVIWTYQLLVRPRERLDEELSSYEGPLPWFAQSHIWRVPSSGDHDYAGGHQHQITMCKLVFLAQLHRDATQATLDEFEAETVQRAARLVVKTPPLTEAFFDARWEIEDLGRMLGQDRQFDWTLDRLFEDDLKAVEGSDQPGLRNETVGEAWAQQVSWQIARRQEREEFCAVTIGRLAGKLGVERVTLEMDEALVSERGVRERLEGRGIELASEADLVVFPIWPPPDWHTSYALGFLQLGSRRTRRGKRLAERSGKVLGRRPHGDGEWELRMESVERSEL